MENFISYAVVNPNAGGKRCKILWNDILQCLKEQVGNVSYKFTSSEGEATLITRQALKEGNEMIISVGGDGTLNEVVNGFFEDDKMINPEAVLGIICVGTGADFIKACSLSRDYKQAAGNLAGRKTKKIDIGKVKFRNHRGERTVRYFINIADFGVGGEIVHKVNRTTKIFGGFISFLYSTLVVSLKYKNKEVKIKIDEEEFSRKIKNVAIANGIAFGGGMKIAPQANLSDGLFEIVILGNLSFLEGARIIKNMYRGEKILHPKVEYYQSKTLSAESKEKVLLDIDGEQPGILPLAIEIIPASLNLKI